MPVRSAGPETGTTCARVLSSSCPTQSTTPVVSREKPTPRRSQSVARRAARLFVVTKIAP